MHGETRRSFDAILARVPRKKDPIHVPVLLRALPTRAYHQRAFWHSFGDIIAITFVVLFSLPAGVVVGEYCREVQRGHAELLSTVTGVAPEHNAVAWLLCGACCVGMVALPCYLCFALILCHTSALLPTLHLCLYGVAVLPLALLLGIAVGKADAVVVLVPVAAFASMLPGLLYNNLAFDCQRAWSTELLLAAAPSSAVTMVLKLIGSHEATDSRVLLTQSRTDVAGTPLAGFTAMLLLDAAVYAVLCLVVLRVVTVPPAVSSHDGGSGGRGRGRTLSRTSSYGEQLYMTAHPLSYCCVSTVSWALAAAASLGVCAQCLLQGNFACFPCVRGGGGGGSAEGKGGEDERLLPVTPRATPIRPPIRPSMPPSGLSTPRIDLLGGDDAAEFDTELDSLTHSASVPVSPLSGLLNLSGSLGGTLNLGRVVEEECAFDVHEDFATGLDFSHYSYSGAVTPDGDGDRVSSRLRDRSNSCDHDAPPVLKVMMLTKHYVTDQKTWAPLARHLLENLCPAWVLGGGGAGTGGAAEDASVVEVLSDINAELYAGSATCLLGSNGGWLKLVLICSTLPIANNSALSVVVCLFVAHLL
jgi:hypothetical protein